MSLIDTYYEIYGDYFSPPEMDKHLTRQIGRITIAWARVEGNVDALISYVHKLGRGAELIQEELPRSFKIKLRYLQRATSRGIIPSHLREDSIRIRRDLKNLSLRRNLLIHGLVSGFENKIKGWKLKTWRIDGAEGEFEHHHIDHLEPDELLVALNAAHEAFYEFAVNVLDVIDPEGASQRKR